MKEFERQLTIVIIVMFLLIASYFFGYRAGVSERESRFVARDTVTVVDTVTYVQPVAKDSTVVRYVTRVVAVSDTRPTGDTRPPSPSNLEGEQGMSADSMAAVLPITQKRYESEEYSAYVSGYEPCLDSIRVYPKTTVIRERERKPPNRWHIGVTGGYGWGFGSKQAEPFVGVGIMWSILSF